MLTINRLAVLCRCYLFCSSLSSSLNCYYSVTGGSCSLNSLSCYSCVGINSYYLSCGDDRIRINSLLSLLVAIASNHCYAEQNSKRQNYFLHFSLILNNKTMLFLIQPRPELRLGNGREATPVPFTFKNVAKLI